MCPEYRFTLFGPTFQHLNHLLPKLSIFTLPLLL